MILFIALIFRLQESAFDFLCFAVTFSSDCLNIADFILLNVEFLVFITIFIIWYCINKYKNYKKSVMQYRFLCIQKILNTLHITECLFLLCMYPVITGLEGPLHNKRTAVQFQIVWMILDAAVFLLFLRNSTFH